jgi:hypothetical protein
MAVFGKKIQAGGRVVWARVEKTCSFIQAVEIEKMARNDWQPASSAALRAILLPAQSPTDPSMCSTAPSPLSHACLGACRNGGHEPIARLDPDALALRLAWHGHSSDAGLTSLLRHAVLAASHRRVAPSSCTARIVFLGDSVTHDTFVAAVAGAMALRLRLERCAWRSPPPCQAARCKARAQQPSPRAKRAMLCDTLHNFSAHPASFASFAVPATWHNDTSSACTTLSLSLEHMQLVDVLVRPHLTAELVGGGRATTIFANEGLWANRATELQDQLHRHVRPLLVALAATPPPRRATLLWRETTPQHFAGASGTGLYAERAGSAAAGAAKATSCSAVDASATERVRKAEWRNRFFDKWSRPWRVKPAHSRASAMASRRLSHSAGSSSSHNSRGSGSRGSSSGGSYGVMPTPGWASALPAGTASILEVVPAFAALLPRHDLHRPPDCTHFCFTPFLWEPVWHAAANVLAQREAAAGMSDGSSTDG